MLDPLRIKNSRTAARAVLNIMAHYGLQPLSYKSVTFAEFMLLALRIFTEDRATALRLEERVYDVVLQLQKNPQVKPVGVMLERALQKSTLTMGDRTWSALTVADLLFLSRGRGYRYTKIVGSQEFKTRIDEVLTKEMQAIGEAFGMSSSTLSLMLAHMVKFDLYSHFYLNAPANVAAIPALKPFAQATLYLALKSFLMAKRDIFDPELKGAGSPFTDEEVQALQRFLQIHGIYRFSDWFPYSASFLNEQFNGFRQNYPELGILDLVLLDPQKACVHLHALQARKRVTT